MPAKIHYEDNLFYLHSILRTVESGLRLDIDPSLFRDKILEDLFFVDSMIMRMYSSLRENDRLIQRTTYLRSLRRTAGAFTLFLDRLLAGDPPFEHAFEPFFEKLERVRAQHAAVRREIDELLDRVDPDEETENTISSAEYNILLAGDPQSEDDNASETAEL